MVLPEVFLSVELRTAVQRLKLDLRDVWVRKKSDEKKEAHVLRIHLVPRLWHRLLIRRVVIADWLSRLLGSCLFDNY